MTNVESNSVFDVAKYILNQPEHVSMTTMKLQKLCFYSQSWHAALLQKPLFQGEFQAWANGPVCYELFEAHRGKFTVTEGDISQGSLGTFTPESTKVIDEVLDAYGFLSGAELSELTHGEPPWQQARAGLPSGTVSHAAISIDSMSNHCLDLISEAS